MASTPDADPRALGDGRRAVSRVEAVEALVAGAVDVLPKPPSGTRPTKPSVREPRVRLVQRRHGRPPSPRRRAPARRQHRPRHDQVRRATAGRRHRRVDRRTRRPRRGPRRVSAGCGAACSSSSTSTPTSSAGSSSWMARASAAARRAGAARRCPLQPGIVYIAPGGTHLPVGPTATHRARPTPETLHRPSVDVLFRSVARAAPGPQRRRAAHRHGRRRRRRPARPAGATATSPSPRTRRPRLVFGMPRAAERLGAARHVLPLDQIARGNREGGD